MVLDKKTLRVVHSALQEDIGREDITTLFTIPVHFRTKAVVLAKQDGVMCGMDIARAAFKDRNKNIRFQALKKDGDSFVRGEHLAYVSGYARPILAAERVVLNFMCLLSGIATETRAFVDRVKDTGAVILDTRKTTPNMRDLEKYAVRCGGGTNHRRALEDAILVKDNHLRAGKFIQGTQVLKERLDTCLSYLRKLPHAKIEIEVENLTEFENVIRHKPDVIMLDNFAVSPMRKAVAYRNRLYPKVRLEASGGVTLKTVRAIAETGVDFISIGYITHSSKAIDLSLEIVQE